MKRFIFIIIMMVMFITGCGSLERTKAAWSEYSRIHDQAWSGYSEICVSGVTYIQFTSGASVKYLPDGKIATCK